MLLLIGCGNKAPDAVKESNDTAKGASVNNETTTDISSSSGTVKGDVILPDSYPKETLPLAVDAEILDVRENPANKGLEVSYVSANDIDTLCDFYEGAFKDAKDLKTDETPDGYWISAMMDGVSYTIMLDKNAMNPNPQYAGKTSVYIILTGLEGVSGSASQMPAGEGEAWPAADLPGVPELKGHIDQILREDGIIRLEITVEDSEKVKGYIDDLTSAGFSFDTQPDIESDHMEFLAFKDSSMISFSYKGEENLVSIDYQE